MKDSRKLFILFNLIKDIEVGDHTLLATVDLESLYTNIRQQDPLDATLWALNKYSELPTSQIKYLVESLSVAMTNNYFGILGSFLIKLKR